MRLFHRPAEWLLVAITWRSLLKQWIQEYVPAVHGVVCVCCMGMTSDVKFHEFFCLEIFHEIFQKFHDVLFRLYTHPFNIFLCIKHYLSFIHAYCSSLSLSAVSKPVKGKYLLLCMNSIMYLLLT